MIGDDVLFASVRDLGALLRARRVSAVELAEACLARLETIGPRLGAVVTVTRERALAQAHRANQELLAGKVRGPLHGIPYGAKDLLATKGIPTSWGAEPLRGQVFDEDATVVRAARGGGGRAVRQARDGRARRRPRLRQPRRELHRPRPHAVEPRPLERRLVERLGGGGRRRPRAVRDRQRDLGLDPHARGLLRRHRPAAHLRPRLAPRRDDALLDARQARADRPQRRRLRRSCSLRSPAPDPADPTTGESFRYAERTEERRPRATLPDRRPAPRDRGRATRT